MTPPNYAEATRHVKLALWHLGVALEWLEPMGPQQDPTIEQQLVLDLIKLGRFARNYFERLLELETAAEDDEEVF